MTGERDRIAVKDLLVRGIVGVNESERRRRQDILLNLEMVTDTAAVGASDDLADGVNYRTVTKEVIGLVETATFFTVEKLAAEIARVILTGHPVEEVRVTVEKPGALRFARSVGVTIVRRADDLP